MFKIGDKVRMNDNYYVSEEDEKKVWTIRRESWNCCGNEIILLEGKGGGYAVRGLSPVKENT